MGMPPPRYNRIITARMQIVPTHIGLAVPVDSLIGFLDNMPDSDLKDILLSVLLTAEQTIPTIDGEIK